MHRHVEKGRGIPGGVPLAFPKLCTNEALVCRPEMTQLGGPPERSEGGEGH
jgi:hypothetical protein